MSILKVNQGKVRGTIWFNGTAIASGIANDIAARYDIIPAEGDFYLKTDTGDYYVLQNGMWAYKATYKGKDGEKGESLEFFEGISNFNEEPFGATVPYRSQYLVNIDVWESASYAYTRTTVLVDTNEYSLSSIRVMAPVFDVGNNTFKFFWAKIAVSTVANNERYIEIVERSEGYRCTLSVWG